MSSAVSFSQRLETQTSDSVRRGPGGFPLFFYDDKHWDKLLHVLSVSLVNGRHLWARCLSGRSLGAQRVSCLAAGTDTPLSASKGPVGREPSPFIVGTMVRFLFQKCVTNTSPSHGFCWQQLQQSSCCQVLLPALPRSAHSPHWGVCSVQISRGQLMSSPWPSHPNYGLQRKTLCVPARTSFICLIIVPLEFESVTGEMFLPSILLICHIITTKLC